MTEFALMLLIINAPRHQWPVHPAQHPAPVVRVTPQTQTHQDVERRQLQRALEDFRKRATGNLNLDRDMRLYVPETRPVNARH